MTTLEKKNHVIHELILDLSFGSVDLPDKLQECINNIQRSTGSKRELLIQQAIGYTVAMKDFNLLDFRICNSIINRLHDARL